MLTMKRRCTCSITINALFIILMILFGVGTAQAADYPRLDEAIPGSFVATVAPVFDFDTDGCLPSAGISRTGLQNPGLNPSPDRSECRSSTFLNTSNTLHRYACAPLNGSNYCGHFYALYFLMDDGVGGHRNDWEYAAVWTKDGVITHASYSAHGPLHIKPIAEVPTENGHPKIVYHKDGLGTHALRFAGWDEVAENPYNRFLTPTLISWFDLSGDGVSNAQMRDKLNSFNYGTASIPMRDDNFYQNINNYKPSGYPNFQSRENCHYSPPFSEEQPDGQTCSAGLVVSGVRCTGRYCDTKELLCCNMSGRAPTGAKEYSPYFSEEGTNYYKNDTRAVVGMRCKGGYCDNVSLITQSFEGSGGEWMPSFSEEQGLGECSDEGYAAGLKCTGSNCDNLSLYCKK